MGSKYKIIMSDSKVCVTLLMKGDSKNLDEVMSHIKRLLSAWGFKSHELSKYFNGESYIDTLKKEIRLLKDKLEKYKNKIFTLPVSRVK